MRDGVLSLVRPVLEYADSVSDLVGKVISWTRYKLEFLRDNVMREIVL